MQEDSLIAHFGCSRGAIRAKIRKSQKRDPELAVQRKDRQLADSFWNEERTALLRQLWADGLPGGRIAARLGIESRGAVIGKINRLGLTRRAKPVLRPASLNANDRVRPVSHEPVKGRVDSSNESQPNYLPFGRRQFKSLNLILRKEPDIDSLDYPYRCHLLDLTNETCRFPIGSPGTPEFFFCGNPQADLAVRVPYCLGCCQRAGISYRRYAA
jgi:GcrA cell cycle regulator